MATALLNIVLIVLACVLAVAAWRALRGPGLEPIVLWYRDR